MDSVELTVGLTEKIKLRFQISRAISVDEVFTTRIEKKSDTGEKIFLKLKGEVYKRKGRGKNSREKPQANRKYPKWKGRTQIILLTLLHSMPDQTNGVLNLASRSSMLTLLKLRSPKLITLFSTAKLIPLNA